MQFNKEKYSRPRSTIPTELLPIHHFVWVGIFAVHIVSSCCFELSEISKSMWGTFSEEGEEEGKM